MEFVVPAFTVKVFVIFCSIKFAFGLFIILFFTHVYFRLKKLDTRVLILLVKDLFTGVVFFGVLTFELLDLELLKEDVFGFE